MLRTLLLLYIYGHYEVKATGMLFLLQMSDDMSEVGGENEGVPMSSASSISNDFASELPNVMSETEDSNSYLEPSSSETDSYMGTGV